MVDSASKTFVRKACGIILGRATSRPESTMPPQELVVCAYVMVCMGVYDRPYFAALKRMVDSKFNDNGACAFRANAVETACLLKSMAS